MVQYRIQWISLLTDYKGHGSWSDNFDVIKGNANNGSIPKSPINLPNLVNVSIFKAPTIFKFESIIFSQAKNSPNIWVQT